MLSQAVRKRVRTAQILSAALMAGVVTVTVAIAVIVQQGMGPAGGGGTAPAGASSTAAMPFLVTLAVLSVTFLAIAYIVMPIVRLKAVRFVFQRAPAEVDAAERLAGPWMNYVLISSAMAESVGLLGAVFYLVTGRPEALAAPAAAVVAMLLAFPTEGRYLSFVRRATGRDGLM